jgi:hypothetical protein
MTSMLNPPNSNLDLIFRYPIFDYKSARSLTFFGRRNATTPHANRPARLDRQIDHGRAYRPTTSILGSRSLFWLP